MIGTTLWLATVGLPASLLRWRLCLSFPLTDSCLLGWCWLSPGHRRTTPVAPGATPPSASPQGRVGSRWHTSESTCNLSQQVTLLLQCLIDIGHDCLECSCLRDKCLLEQLHVLPVSSASISKGPLHLCPQSSHVLGKGCRCGRTPCIGSQRNEADVIIVHFTP